MKKWLYIGIIVWGLWGAYHAYNQNWLALEAIFTWMLAGGIFFAILQVYQARKSTNAQLALDIFNELRSDKSKATLSVIYQLTPDDIYYLSEPPICRHRYYQNLKNQINGLLDKYVLLGTLINNNIVEESLAIEGFGGVPALRCWYKLAEYIREETPKRGSFVENYEVFTRRCKDYFLKKRIEVRLYEDDSGKDSVELIHFFSQKERGQRYYLRNQREIKKDRKKMKITTGYSKNDLPYARIQGGPRTLFIIDGLDFSHKPPSGFQVSLTGYIKKLLDEYTVYQVRRRPGLPIGYSLKDMADDCAVMVRDEIGGPVDVMGVSTGGTIAQHFAVGYPELVDRLILAMTGHCLTDNGKMLQWRVAGLTRQGQFRSAAALMSDAVFSGIWAKLFKPFFWIMGNAMFASSSGPSDGIIEVEAEDKHDFRDRLAEIKAPTLVIGGENDFFYPVRETAEGIPGAKLVLYEGTGHTAIMKSRFGSDIREFLVTDSMD